MEKICEVCSKPFSTQRAWQKYCCYGCRLEKQKGSYASVGEELASGTIGTLGELRVAIDLLLKGYDVFRAISPSCSCDLAVLRNSKLIRVEVTTGHYYYGKLRPSSVKKYQRHQYDVLATVSPDGQTIIYDGTFETA